MRIIKCDFCINTLTNNFFVIKIYNYNDGKETTKFDCCDNCYERLLATQVK